jgi:hypothetical protein
MPHFAKDELERRIDEVLFYKWDPIGVNKTPAARFEYRSYVKKILEIVNQGKGANDIAHHLAKLESGMLAMKPNMEKLTRIATLILEHKEAIENGRA